MIEGVKQIEVLVDSAVLGEQVDSFVKSDVGQFLLERARVEQAEGYAELKTVSFQDAEGVRAAQNKVWRAESIAQWLNEAIMSGVRAMEVLESREDD